MTVPSLETRSVDVLTDGGSRIGVLVLSKGKLAAVLIRVDGRETGRPGSDGGWYLEAGFGPCGALMTLQPEVFPQQWQALDWIRNRLSQIP
jgi:hypothetical protein